MLDVHGQLPGVCSQASTVWGAVVSSGACSAGDVLRALGEVVAVTLAQRELGELAGRGAWNRVDKDIIVRKPPFREFIGDKLPDLVGCNSSALLRHNERERPLVPLWMRHCDHGRFSDGWMGHYGIFQVDRTNPLTARFDEILATVGYLNKSLAVNGGNITRAQPPVRGKFFRVGCHFKVSPGNVRAAHL